MMNDNISPPLHTSRIFSIDALRGYAIATLMLLHATQHFLYHEYAVSSVAWIAAWNQSVRETLVFLFSEKSFCIFALLFGFTFYLLYNKQAKQGGDFKWRFAWRMLLLFIFGIVNVAFFPGDVLLSYALCGLVLIPLRKLSSGLLIAIACLFLVHPGEWYMLIRGCIDSGYVPLDNGYMQNYAPMKQNIAEGSWLATWASNIRFGSHAALGWMWDVGRISQTCALFIFGFVAGRVSLFADTEKNRTFWARLFCISLILAAALYPLYSGVKVMVAQATHMQPLQDILFAWYNLSFTALTVALFVLLYRSEFFVRITKPFSIYGKASLSNYIAQSVLGAFIFYPAGLNLAQHTGMISSVLIAIGVVILQITATHFYLKKFNRGPLEALWHRLTWVGK